MELFKLMGTIAVNNSDANQAIDETTEKAEGSKNKLNNAFSKIGSAAVKVGKAAAIGIGAAATGISVLTKQAIGDYAEYEQLVGGVETLFKESSDKVLEYANNAYKTAGLSANDYMETVTSFSASLLQSLDGDTAKAAEKADLAITDMSDNANKMGTSMESIQNAYQGFAKQNYTMLDNLKLGYGGTKEEMERLLEDASKLSGIEYDISSYSDIVDAIHVVQTELGITGTTAEEASSTIQGSIGQMKGAWENFMTGMADPDQDFDALLGNLVDSVVTVADNIVPRIMKTLPRIVKGIEGVVKSLSKYIPGILKELIPPLISAATEVIQGLVDILPSLIDVIVETLPLFIDGAIKIVIGIVNALPQIIEQLVAALPGIIETIVNTLSDNLPALIEGCVKLVIGIAKAMPTIIKAVLDVIPQVVTKLIEAFNKAFPKFKKAVKAKFDEIAKVVSKVWDGIKSTISKKVDTIKTTVTSTFTKVKDAMLKPIEKARDSIKKIVDKIKGFFNFDFKLPKIKLPHFSISPSGWKVSDLLKGSIPKLGIDWYAKAMDNPMLMTRPTAFGVNAAGQIMAGGEKGSEVVSGTDTLMNMISQAVAAQNSGMNEALNKILDLLAEYVPDMANTQIVMDSGALVGTLTPAIDRQLGQTMKLKARGV